LLGVENLESISMVIVITVAASTWGCARLWGPGSGQTATVTLNDGSTFNGTYSDPNGVVIWVGSYQKFAAARAALPSIRNWVLIPSIVS
jgi:hypothetical protein